MKKSLMSVLVLMLVLSMVLAGCGGSSDTAPAGEKTFVTVVTGGTSGPYFALGGTISNLLNEHVEGINSSVESTGASKVNCTKLGSKDAEIAFAMNNVVSFAYTGTESFKDSGKIENLRGIASMYPNFCQVITLEGTGIKEISDLKGKRVGVGAPGSGVEVDARNILKIHGITYDDINEDFLSYAESVEQLKNGTVDAAFLTSGLPNAAIMDLATTHDVKIVPIRKEMADKLHEEIPHYGSEMIPAGTYDNEEDVETVAVKSILITRDDLSEELVYNITKTIFENLDALVGTHNAAKKISLDTVRDGMPVPLHPGAEKYFNELGK